MFFSIGDKLFPLLEISEGLFLPILRSNSFELMFESGDIISSEHLELEFILFFLVEYLVILFYSCTAQFLIEDHLIFSNLLILLVILVFVILLGKVNSHAFEELLGKRRDVLVDFEIELVRLWHNFLDDLDKLFPAIITNSLDAEHLLSLLE